MNKNRNTKITKLHLLKPHAGEAAKTAPEELEKTKQALEQRVGRMEQEMKDSILQLQKEWQATLKQAGLSREETHLKAELARLTALLENRIQTLGEIKHPQEERVIPAAPKAGTWKKFNHYLTRLISPKTYKRMLFGVTRVEKQDFDEFGRDPDFEKRVKPIFDFLYHQYWRVSVEGLENIPNKGKGLIVANHSGTLPFDGSMIRLAVTNDHPSRRDVRFLVEDFVYYLPFVGTFMYRIGGVRASQDNAERLLRKGHLVTVFPEGEKGIGKTYKHRYHLQRFGRGGFIKLALRTGAPILPCAVIGAEETHPLLYRWTFLAKPFGIPYVPITPTIPWFGPLGLIGLPSKWSVYFGKPIHLDQYGKEAADDELLVHRLGEMVRQNIQEMIVQGLKKRRSIWFG
ncbi:MAG: 1-acyl-sn-glycerol-3-phosphate acyltransferase [bacterium]